MEERDQQADGSPTEAPSAPMRARILNQLPVAVTFFGRDQRLAMANAAAASVVARSEASLLGLLPGEVEPGVVVQGGAGLADAIDRVMRTGEAESYETYLLLVGSKHVWQAMLTPVRDGAGELLGVSVVTVDTTDQFWARERMAVLDRANTRIGSTLDVGRTAEELAQLATEGFADFVTVDLLAEVLTGDEARSPRARDEIRFLRVAQSSVLEGCPESIVRLGQAHTFDRESAIGRTLLLGEAARYTVDEETLSEWKQRDPDRVHSLRKHRIHSGIVAPLRARGITLGMAMFCRHRTPEPFGDSDLSLCGELVARAAVCVDNARRYTRERATALALQRSLLPSRSAPQRAVEVTSRYVPSTVGAGIGGDWFDVIPLSGARVALVVGDVVGHGIHASATMGRLRTAVRALAEVDLAPEELLTQLDDLVMKLDREEEAGAAGTASVAGATCLYAVYDPISCSCTMARAGHPEPVLARPHEYPEKLALPAGPALGAGGAPFEAARFELPEGSRLALYTDGLLAAPGPDADASLAELCHLLAPPEVSLDRTCDTVMSALVPERPVDDVAFVLARTRRLDQENHASWDLAADPAVVVEARRRAAGQLEAWGLGDAVLTTELVVSELVTNAIRYGGPPITLRLIRDLALVCEVSDGSSTAPHLRRARMYDEGGRGLLLVASVTERWGTRYSGNGKTIWAQLPLSGATDTDVS
ncbi:SpoIIE family protein phosphatase [Streptomyces sp. B1I3]|uniref:SpoIIE family protein phosphatase n=1 Tax=Streptomyces sp. B1I3 TaxID=3042264 RepID=UPI00278B6EF1|nr:SpoIIE family protein phosphatase [Streptomyces sp. B1I3]MDQ0792131.1 serine phosphatase RsbU (regulator of sigma subunit)/anti-sigma regulatory factor (Ser/Thr protein kinase) [Streptomyces sp. B1I3]